MTASDSRSRPAASSRTTSIASPRSSTSLSRRFPGPWEGSVIDEDDNIEAIEDRTSKQTINQTTCPTNKWVREEHLQFQHT